MDTVLVSIELPRDAFSALRQDPEGFARAMRLAAINDPVSQGYRCNKEFLEFFNPGITG